jgi:hypothetical protein
MKEARRFSRWRFLCTAALLLLSIFAKGQTEQAPAQSADELMSLLRDEHPIGPSTCGSRGTEYLREQDAAVRVVALGSAATPQVEAAVQSIETSGGDWTHAWWLVHVYARMKGPAAFPVLSRMMHDPRLKDLRGSFDDSAALALGLTSYVDSAVVPSFGICDPFERRHGLNLVIFAWETGDLDMLWTHLGPHAVAALDSLLAKRSWQDLRRDLSAPVSAKDVLVGYGFDVPPPWGEPYEALESKVERLVRARAMPLDEDAVLKTTFTDRSGSVCGRRSIAFATTDFRTLEHGARFEGAGSKYFVDNADLADLLHLISACAAQ